VDNNETRFHRRTVLKRSTAWVAVLAGLTSVWSGPASSGKVARDIVQYRDEPRKGKACVNCWAYVNGRNQGEGTCKVVEGPISPNGWCMAFSPKRRQTTS
jgi:high potential iron-sulfur protein